MTSVVFPRMGRRTFLAGVGATVLGTACDRGGETAATATGSASASTASTASATTPRRTGSLRWKGVNYDTGTAYVTGFDSRREWRRDFVERELTAIRDELHCNAVILYGSFPERLAEAAVIATGLGLNTWLSPRLPDATTTETLKAIGAAAGTAESIRHAGHDIGLIVGCELTIFMTGLVDGDDVAARAQALTTSGDGGHNARLGAFLADAVTTTRATFDGPLTYSAGTWELVDWTPFDAVGSNLYRAAHNVATYRKDLRHLFEHDRPVLITEFGCAAYRGAADKGPDGDDIGDWSTDPPTLTGRPVRDEHVQADYLDELLDLFEANHVDGAFVFQFIEPAAPHHPDPTRDLDMAALSLVRVDATDTTNSYERTGRWTPKLAFHALAGR